MEASRLLVAAERQKIIDIDTECLAKAAIHEA
jgi:hypothetical protein